MAILSNLFVQIVHMTFIASIVIGVVLLVRVLLKRAPKVFSYMLWAVVLFRLLCPVSVSSEFSLFGLIEESVPVNEIIEYTPIAIETPSEMPESSEIEINNSGIQDATVEVAPKREVWQVSAGILAGVWLIGMSALLVYSIAQLYGLKRCLKGAVPYQDNIFLTDYITSPFVLGVIAPKIYLPSDLDGTEYEYIILHEKHHIRRGDHIIKIIAYLALCIHWFNPLVWLSFVLAGKDMEMSCDEAVIRKMGVDIRARYSESLLRFATGQRMMLGMPLAFGEGETKGRVKNVMRYKKTKFWISMIAVLLCIIAGVCLLTNPKTEKDNEVVEEMAGIKMPGQEENQETEFIPSEPEEEVISEPAILTEPPEMLLQDALSSQLDFFPVASGTYSWAYPANENEMTAIEACGAFPTVAVKGQEWIRLTKYNGIDYTPYSMRFERQPDKITVREYDSLELGDENATCLSEKVLDNVYLLELEPRRIYEVVVEWDEAKLKSNGFYGTAYYAFATWDSTMYLEPEEEETQISIVAHVKEVMADRKNSVVISSDTDEFPGAYILEIPEDVYDIKELEGGDSISVIMKKSEDNPLNTLEVYDAIYIKSVKNDEK